jgi:hypothetical protein
MSSGGWLTAIAAVLTGAAGILTAWAAVVRARNEGRRDCEQHLEVARAEAETASAELHQLRMRHPDDR